MILDRFPLELHSHITSFIQHPPDLNSLSQVSWYWLSIARPVLYCDLVLRSNDVFVQDTISLLNRHHSLTSSITSLTLVTNAVSEVDLAGERIEILPGAWVNLAKFAGLHNVRRVKIDGVPEISLDEFRQMFTDIFFMTTRLEEISCIDSNWTGFEAHRNGYFKAFSDLPFTLEKLTFKFECTCTL